MLSYCLLRCHSFLNTTYSIELDLLCSTWIEWLRFCNVSICLFVVAVRQPSFHRLLTSASFDRCLLLISLSHYNLFLSFAPLSSFLSVYPSLSHVCMHSFVHEQGTVCVDLEHAARQGHSEGSQGCSSCRMEITQRNRGAVLRRMVWCGAWVSFLCD